MDGEHNPAVSSAEVSPTIVHPRDHVLAEAKVVIGGDTDIVSVRQKGREMAATLEFSPSELTLIATAISELARNIVLYAKKGEIALRLIERGELRGILVHACDHGPGIPDIRRVLQGGYSTSRSLGLGLSGVRRLMDEFEIESKVGSGTRVTVRKWNKR
ncbi:MAG TPA: anti-sigma regulatory factor [Candidatus Acidoferrales bacterium]|nr:anti-sigma regulatory factor [Candidatus Acidoferrales bacterium]